MTIEVISKGSGSLNIDSTFGPIRSLRNKLVIITDFGSLKDIEEKIKHRDIFLLVVCSYVSITRYVYPHEFFGLEKPANINFKSGKLDKLNLPSHIRVKNFLVYLESGHNELNLMHENPTVYSYCIHDNLTYLTIVNELLNAERELESIDQSEIYRLIKPETTDAIIDLSNFVEAETIFIEGDNTNAIIVTHNELPKLISLEGSGTIENIREFQRLTPALQTISLMSEGGMHMDIRKN